MRRKGREGKRKKEQKREPTRGRELGREGRGRRRKKRDGTEDRLGWEEERRIGRGKEEEDWK